MRSLIMLACMGTIGLCSMSMGGDDLAGESLGGGGGGDAGAGVDQSVHSDRVQDHESSGDSATNDPNKDFRTYDPAPAAEPLADESDSIVEPEPEGDEDDGA